MKALAQVVWFALASTAAQNLQLCPESQNSIVVLVKCFRNIKSH
jgi:hypothetical protein